MGAFPDNPIIDNFDRANENPFSASGNWESGFQTADTLAFLALNSNQVLRIADGGVYSSVRWRAQFPANQEAYMTNPIQIFSTYPGMQIILRSTGTGGSHNCYTVESYSNASPSTAIRISKIVGGTATALKTVTGLSAWVNSSRIAARVIGSTISVYRDVSGTSAGWSFITSYVDTAITGPGSVGFRVWATSDDGLAARWDNFGGGQASEDLTPPFIHTGRGSAW